MKETSMSQDHGSGEICPGCERELVLLVSEVGAERVECDCGSAHVLVAA